MLRIVCAALLLTASIVAASVAVNTQLQTPRIWNEAALSDWATPIAALNVRPAHYTPEQYYSAPVDNLRTYPVYHPDEEPAGYWNWLQQQKPQPLVDASQIQTRDDWIRAGERAFRELDAPLSRTDDPAAIASARAPASFANVLKLADGTVHDPRWVVTERGVMLTVIECSGCHFSVEPDRTVRVAGPGGPLPSGVSRLSPAGPNLFARMMRQAFHGETPGMIRWRLFTTPWAPDERIERMRTMAPDELPPQDADGVFARMNGSPFYQTRIPDLQNLSYSRYIDATATHRLRGPEDVARYGALINFADPLDFGTHRMKTDAQRRVPFRYADEVLYAIGMYLMSLEPPRNPTPAPGDVLDRGEAIFRREGCVNCHTPPTYISSKLTLAQGWRPPANHPNREDIMPVSVGTDPGLATRTRKGTGFYKIPSLRGVWYRPRLLHDGSFATLEEMFDPARLRPDFVPRGWSPPGVTTRAVPGHVFGLNLSPSDKGTLLAFLRSL